MQTTLDNTAITAPSNGDTHTIAGLIGHIPEWQFFQLIQIENLIETRSHEELHDLWKDATTRCTSLVNSPSSKHAATYLPRSLEKYEQEIRQRPTYKRYYEGCRFSLVPVQELVTVQWYVNLDHVEALKQKAPQPGNIMDALDFVYDEGEITLDPPCASTINGLSSLAFQAPGHRNLGTFFAPLHPFEVQRVNSRKFSLTIHAEIELTPNYLSLAKYGARYIILNGVHRSLALLQAGWQCIPCLVRDTPTIRSLTELGFQQNAGLLSDELTLRSTRPTYISDYLDTLAAPRFQRKNVNVLWQIIPQVIANKQSIS